MRLPLDNIEMLKTLIKHGADVNASGMGSEIPLHQAMKNGKFQKYWRFLKKVKNVW